MDINPVETGCRGERKSRLTFVPGRVSFPCGIIIVGTLSTPLTPCLPNAFEQIPVYRSIATFILSLGG